MFAAENRPTNFEEAKNFVISGPAAENETRVSNILDLEKISIKLEKLGVSNSLNGILEKIENILSEPTFDEDFKNDKNLQEIIVSSLEKSLVEIKSLALRVNAILKLGGQLPEGIKISSEQIEELDLSSEDILKSIQVIFNLIYTYIARLQPLLSKDQARSLGVDVEEDEQTVTSASKKDPYQMNIEEVIEEISNAIIPTDRLKDLNARYFELIGTVEDKQLESWYRTKRGLQAIMVAGDTGVKGFDIRFDAIMVELADKGVDFTNIARALFLKRPKKKGIVTAEEMDKAEIDMGAIEVYEYIVKRIKHNPDFGGINTDKALYGDLNFSYNKLLGGDQLSKFTAHLKNKFGKKIPDEARLDELIKYAQATASKSAGYVPWLMRATTRAHGLALAGLRGESFSDELFVAAPFAADQYSRTRYADNKANSTSEDLYFIPEHLLEDMVELGVRHDSKFHSLKELTKLINEYRDACYDELPKWVRDVRNLMDISKNGVDVPETKLDLNANWFPLPGEVVPNILKMEQRKRDIQKMKKGPARSAAEKALLKDAQALGYGKDIDGIGIPQLTSLTVDQYMVSFKAMEMFNKAFREQPKYMDKEQCVEKFIHWMDKIVGKAKLVPGRHHLLFGPFTVRMIHHITRSYSMGHNADAVDELRLELLKELKGAGGLPDNAREYVLKELDNKFHVKSLVRYVYKTKRWLYAGNLWRYKNEHPISIEKKIASIAPGTMGKGNIPFEAPWDFDHVSEDTSK